MTSALLLLFVVLLVVLAFEYINGFHDTANAIATVVSTKVHLLYKAMSPGVRKVYREAPNELKYETFMSWLIVATPSSLLPTSSGRRFWHPFWRKPGPGRGSDSRLGLRRMLAKLVSNLRRRCPSLPTTCPSLTNLQLTCQCLPSLLRT